MRTGLDRLSRADDLLRRLRGSRTGLLSHPASVDAELRHARDVLADLGIRPAILFGPEHGYGGDAQDMIGVASAEGVGGTPVRSLYGATFADLSPTHGDLSVIDTLVVDLQDVGARYYTFVWTALLALRACARAGVRVVVLDRPNPLGGDIASLEGRMQTTRFCSFVGLEPIAVRHGLTIGEILAWRAHVEAMPEGLLEIVAVEGLERSAHAPAWDRPFVLPSPNMPTYETALVYPGGCLLEGTNLSEGRGTTRPFEIFGAPWVDGVRLARGLNALGLGGFVARPLTFQPTFHKHSGAVCGGVQLHVRDARAFRPMATYLAAIALVARNHVEFALRTEPYEFVEDIPAIDLLTGSATFRLGIEARTPVLTLVDAVAMAGDEERGVTNEARAAFERLAS